MMNPGQERQAAADAINNQVIEDMKIDADTASAANSVNEKALKEPTIADLQAQLDTLRLQTPEDDVRIAEIQARIEAIQKRQ